MPCEPEHLALRTAEKRGRHDVDDTHERAYPRVPDCRRLLSQDASSDLARTSQS
jgi:hypothetical protein